MKKRLSPNEGGGDRKINAAYLVGRRFEWRPVHVVQGRGTRRLPDVTFVSADPQANSITAHLLSGGSQKMTLSEVVEAVYEGFLVESELGVPFVNERGSR